MNGNVPLAALRIMQVAYAIKFFVRKFFCRTLHILLFFKQWYYPLLVDICSLSQGYSGLTNGSVPFRDTYYAAPDQAGHSASGRVEET
jgi:hypothetical protein